jgi:hypothetical protein
MVALVLMVVVLEQLRDQALVLEVSALTVLTVGLLVLMVRLSVTLVAVLVLVLLALLVRATMVAMAVMV